MQNMGKGSLGMYFLLQKALKKTNINIENIHNSKWKYDDTENE